MSQEKDTIGTLRKQLLQLRELHAGGALPAEQYDAARLPLEQRLVQLVVDQPESIEPPPKPVTMSAAAPSTTPDAPQPRSSAKLLGFIAAAVVLVAAAGYLWKGTPTQPSAAGATAEDASAPHPTDTAQITAMVERLAERLKERPDDVQGWSMLGRSYIALGRKDDAMKTYAEALKRFPQNAELMADYADSLAALNDHQMGDDAMKWVERALKIDPRNIKGLALAGTYAFDHGDFKGAVKYWQKLADIGPSDNPIVQQMAPALAEARDKAGLPPLLPPAPFAAQGGAPGAGSAPAGFAAVRGTVTLAPALRSRAQADDTVFVYARDASGASRMPLAILRKQVRDLPLQFTLDDSMAMSPNARLSTAGRVVVEARISKSGNAMPQAGDLRGTSEPLSPGGSPVQITISEAVGP